jgi:deoxyribonuclease V
MPRYRAPHAWNLAPSEAIALQKVLAAQVIREDSFADIKLVAGVDVGFEDNNRISRAAVAVLSYPGLEPVEHAIARRPTVFPYIPGLLSFREIPVVLDALGRLKHTPDLLLCDGQGLAHPRRLGIASHLGIITGLPSIGVGKSRLTGTHDAVPEGKGEWTPLLDKGEIIGAVLRTRCGVKPIYVSIGHKICLASAIAYVMGCVTRYKLPETTRQAHRLASQK